MKIKGNRFPAADRAQFVESITVTMAEAEKALPFEEAVAVVERRRRGGDRQDVKGRRPRKEGEGRKDERLAAAAAAAVAGCGGGRRRSSMDGRRKRRRRSYLYSLLAVRCGSQISRRRKKNYKNTHTV